MFIYTKFCLYTLTATKENVSFDTYSSDHLKACQVHTAHAYTKPILQFADTSTNKIKLTYLINYNSKL